MKYLKAKKNQDCYVCKQTICKDEQYQFASFGGFRTSFKVCKQCVTTN